ncbi:hypothetical protein MGYG_03816 [Nannizzia gypsea CBS 118893]|uniref:Uncharacterized protein n=1 Tax=Arthroderma gypseum (strain ATCC MYA-4604 / CBS 118893) TaxID=535722 RepID=E4UU45_ARTGP|nr:hypothetical protein MGYG_03816 [Nannizzia gypsea CBS 118893]EFR00812.1 hypothetical protein MGYG_03816 [Nannizzia gypsea CBS 118893]
MPWWSFPSDQGSLTAPQRQTEQLKGVSADDFSPVRGNADEPVRFPHAENDKTIESMLELGEVMKHIKHAPSPVELRQQSQGSSAWEPWKLSTVDCIVDREEKYTRQEGRKPDVFPVAIMDETFGFIVAGLGTISTTMCLGAKLLADNSDAQSGPRQALLTAFSAAIAEKRTPSVEEIMNNYMVP